MGRDDWFLAGAGQPAQRGPVSLHIFQDLATMALLLAGVVASILVPRLARQARRR